MNSPRLYHDLAPAPPPPPRPMPGAGTRLTSTAAGFVISAPDRSAKFRHPFKPSLSARGVRFSRGLVDGFEPKIGEVPISGPPGGGPQPYLTLDPELANENGESWCCVEVMPNAAGILDPKSKIQLIHTKEPRLLSPDVGRAPLAMILWRHEKPWRALEIVHFNLRYARVLPPAGAGAVRHLFF